MQSVLPLMLELLCPVQWILATGGYLSVRWIQLTEIQHSDPSLTQVVFKFSVAPWGWWLPHWAAVAEHFHHHRMFYRAALACHHFSFLPRLYFLVTLLGASLKGLDCLLIESRCS